MGRYTYRPGFSTHYGDTVVSGGGNILGDGNDATGTQYKNDSGSICTYGTFNPSVIPSGRDIIAVKVGHRQVNGGLLGIYNGWIGSYLRVGGSRVPNSYAYKQDGYSDSVREILGPAVYKTGGAGGWAAEEINTMSSDIGAAVGNIGPNTKNRWCAAVESFIAVYYNDPVPVPNTPFPANGATVATSSVNFNATHVAPQDVQPVRTIFQVARDSAFTNSVKTFVGGLNASVTAGSKSYYNSNRNDATFTDLGPGLWYLRMKGRDYTDTRESAWSGTTTFTVSHPALPVPTFVAPLNAGTVATPYSVRSASFTDPAGDRKVGIEWVFSQASDFAGTQVRWWNTKDAGFIGKTVSYNPQPSGSTLPGLYGPNVSSEDPPQYLKQGTWYGMVRTRDVYGQWSSWSSVINFTVVHKPYASNYFPQAGQSFDQYATPVRWTFSDPWAGDLQSAYQMIVETTTGVVLQDTGKVTSSVPSAQMNVGSGHLLENLRYSVKLWDLDDVVSTVNPTQNFLMSLSPVITLPYPAAEEAIVTGQPTIDWSVTFTGGSTQKSWKVDFVQADNQVVVHSSGTIANTTTVYTPPRAILKNLINYQVKVTVTDTADLSSTLVRDFTTDFIRPSYCTTGADASEYEENGYVNVYWVAEPDAFFAEWRIYRKKIDADGLPLGDWEFVGTEEDVDARTYRDWSVAGTSHYRYSVTQVAYRFGSLVESDFDEIGERVYLNSSDYWLLVEDDETMNVRLMSVVGDKATDRRESNDFVIIGAGRRVNYGTWIGLEGTLSCQIRQRAGITATEQLRVLRRLSEEKRYVNMRDPFGNVTKISLGEISRDRIAGVGNNEYADIEIPYYEVG